MAIIIHASKQANCTCITAYSSKLYSNIWTTQAGYEHWSENYVFSSSASNS